MNDVGLTTGSQAPQRALLGQIVRLGIVKQALVALRQVGGDPVELFRELGLELRLLDDPGAQISFRALGSLMRACSRHADCNHFGLIVGGSVGLEELGELGRTMRGSDTVGSALRRFIAHASRGSGAIVTLEVDHDVAVLRFLPYDPEAEAIAILGEAFLSAATRVLRDLCGPHWTPFEVLIPRRVPARVDPYRSFFRAPVRFDDEAAALVFPSSTLMRVLPIGDVFESSEAPEISPGRESANTLSDPLRRFVRAELLHRNPGLTDVARRLSLHRRTMNRRLRAEGTHYRSLVNEVRFAIARQLVADTDIPLAQVSAALHFSEPAAFTRAFERWAGLPPSRVREEYRRAAIR